MYWMGSELAYHFITEVWKLKMAKEVWDAICAKHETMALTVRVDMRCCMYELKCQDDAHA